jgi:hypothetical protein
MTRDLVRDVLDEQLVDRHGVRIGKVDGVVLEVREGRPPRVVAVETGAVTLAARLHPRLGRWLARLIRHWGLPVNARERIPWSRVSFKGIDLRVDADAEEMGALAAERWLRERVVGRIPGSRR